MPEEIINNEIVNEAAEKAVEAVVAAPKKGRAGKFALGALLVTGAFALGTWIYTKANGKRNPKEEATTDEGEPVDNVKIAERDCLDNDESEE